MRRYLPGLLALALAALLWDLVLIAPNHPGAVTWRALEMKPLELPAILLGLFALGLAGRRWALALALAATAMTLVKATDLASNIAFDRSFDPVVDLNLVPAGLRLLAGSVGLPATVAAVLTIVVVLALIAAGLTWAGRRWARAGAGAGKRWRGVAAAIAVVFALLSAAEIRTALGGWRGWNPPGDAFTTRLAAEHVRDAIRSRAAFAEFAAAARADAFAGHTGLFSRLNGRNVTVIFIESYGRASFDNPLYAPLHEATLEAGAEALAARGLEMRSGWLTSPVIGGQSWLAHASLSSGLSVTDQRRYLALLASPRQGLTHYAAAAGYATMVAAPAITLTWPEGPKEGWQLIYPAAKLGYRGKPFNWVTMPDQFTLAALDRLMPKDGPVFAEAVLVSSHAPWTPVPKMVPWEAVGDGTVFDPMTEGPSPQEVWADPDRTRAAYRDAIDYSLQAVLSWAALPRDTPPLVMVLGDHQAVGFVSQTGGQVVPMHLIGPPEVLALFDDWGWTRGPVPDATLAPVPMEAFRDRFLEAVSAPTGDRS